MSIGRPSAALCLARLDTGATGAPISREIYQKLNPVCRIGRQRIPVVKYLFTRVVLKQRGSEGVQGSESSRRSAQHDRIAHVSVTLTFPTRAAHGLPVVNRHDWQSGANTRSHPPMTEI